MLRRKYRKKYFTFSVPIMKELDNGKTITYKKQSLLIALELYQAHYQALLIIYLKFIAKSVEGVKKERKSNKYMIL